MKLELGMTGEATTIVVRENSASFLGAGGGDVFATPMMILLMENASAGAVAHALDAGDASVGILVNVRHLAATPLGQQMRAVAGLVEIDGKRLGFKVEGYHEHK